MNFASNEEMSVEYFDKKAREHNARYSGTDREIVDVEPRAGKFAPLSYETFIFFRDMGSFYGGR